MAALIVSYPGTAENRFDADYYCETHIPLVEELWGPLGLVEAEVFLPEGGQPWRAAVVLRFADAGAIDGALASAGTAQVMDDVPRFTDIAPVIYRAA
ncbi:MAG TPA: EthD family reductase [Novosphingobium sp.]|nr:EthD family reductase [Novosphingobium sp.]